MSIAALITNGIGPGSSLLYVMTGGLDQGIEPSIWNPVSPTTTIWAQTTNDTQVWTPQPASAKTWTPQ